MLEICALRLSFLHKFTLILHHAFAPCSSDYCIFSQIYVPSKLYAVRPPFLISTPVSRFESCSEGPRFDSQQG